MPIQQEHKPTCMAVQGVDSNIDILVGFSDGAFSLYSLRDKGEIFLEYSKVSEDGPLTAVDAMPAGWRRGSPACRRWWPSRPAR